MKGIDNCSWGGMEIIRGRHCRFMSKLPQTDKLQVSGLDDIVDLFEG